MESDLPDAQLIEVVSQRCADRKLNETKRGSLRRRHRRFWPQIRRGTEFRGSIHDEPPEPPSSAMFFNYSTRHSLKTTRFTDTLLVPQVVVDSPPRILLTPFERRFTVSKRPSFPDQMTTSGRPMKTLSLMKSLHGQLGNLQVTLALMGRYL